MQFSAALTTSSLLSINLDIKLLTSTFNFKPLIKLMPLTSSIIFGKLSFNFLSSLSKYLPFDLTFSKIYPVVSGAVLFVENKERSIKKILLIIFAMVVVSIFYLILNFEEYLNFFNG